MQTDERVRALWSPYATSPDTKFKFTPIGFNCTIPIPRQREIIQSFSWMDFKGPVDLKNPEVDVSVLEDWPEPILPAGQALPHLRKRVFVGRKVGWRVHRLYFGCHTVLTSRHRRNCPLARSPTASVT